MDETTQKRIKEGQLVTEILKQEDLAPLPFEKQVALFYAVLQGHFAGFDLSTIKETERAFLEHLEKLGGGVLEELRLARELTPEIEEKLKSLIARFVESKK